MKESKEVKKEKQHLKALNTEKELARRDELTGIKNKTAYTELEKSVQTNIDNGMDYLPFGLVVCDANDLKKINDTKGHAAGDDYIRKSSKLLCDTFVHSPVFRIGGDEFVVFIRGDDYSNREKLMKELHEHVQKNLQSGKGPVVPVQIMSIRNSDASFHSSFAEAGINQTLQQLKDQHPDSELILLMGTDMFLTFHRCDFCFQDSYFL